MAATAEQLRASLETAYTLLCEYVEPTNPLMVQLSNTLCPTCIPSEVDSRAVQTVDEHLEGMRHQVDSLIDMATSYGVDMLVLIHGEDRLEQEAIVQVHHTNVRRVTARGILEEALDQLQVDGVAAWNTRGNDYAIGFFGGDDPDSVDG